MKNFSTLKKIAATLAALLLVVASFVLQDWYMKQTVKAAIAESGAKIYAGDTTPRPESLPSSNLPLDSDGLKKYRIIPAVDLDESIEWAPELTAQSKVISAISQVSTYEFLDAVFCSYGRQELPESNLEKGTAYNLKVQDVPEELFDGREVSILVSYAHLVDKGTASYVEIQISDGGEVGYRCIAPFRAADDLELIHGSQNYDVYSGDKIHPNASSRTLTFEFYTSANDRFAGRPYYGGSYGAQGNFTCCFLVPKGDMPALIFDELEPEKVIDVGAKNPDLDPYAVPTPSTSSDDNQPSEKSNPIPTPTPFSVQYSGYLISGVPSANTANAPREGAAMPSPAHPPVS